MRLTDRTAPRPTSSRSTTRPGRRPVGPVAAHPPGQRGRSVLESALTYLPGPSSTASTPDTSGSTDSHGAVRPHHLRGHPARSPAGPADPGDRADEDVPARGVTGTLTRPGIGTLPGDEPILRYVDLATVHIADAAAMTLPDWARTVIPGPAKAPLLYSGTRAGSRRRSWPSTRAIRTCPSRSPSRSCFEPGRRAHGWLDRTGRRGRPGHGAPAGDPDRGDRRPRRPAGRLGRGPAAGCRRDDRDVRGDPAARGLHRDWHRRRRGLAGRQRLRGASPSAAASASSTPAGSPGASASGSGASRVRRRPGGRGHRPVRRGPVRRGRIDDHAGLGGRPRGARHDGRRSGQPGGSPAPAGTTDPVATRPAARDELWIPLLVLVLVLLCIEWAVYERDSLSRGRRALLARLGRPARRPVVARAGARRGRGAERGHRLQRPDRPRARCRSCSP